MTEKTGIALRTFKLATGHKRRREVAKDAEVTLPANQFDDLASVGFVAENVKPKKKAKKAETANPGDTTAKGADE